MEVVLVVLGQPCNFREAEVCLVWTQNVKTRARWGGQAPPCLVHRESPETLKCLAEKQRKVGGYLGTSRCGAEEGFSSQAGSSQLEGEDPAVCSPDLSASLPSGNRWGHVPSKGKVYAFRNFFPRKRLARQTCCPFASSKLPRRM